MKNAVLSLVVLSISGFAFAQDSNNGVSTLELDEATISFVNAHYLTEVMDENTPDISKELQMKAARYDLISNPEYNPREDKPFDVLFKASNGELLASYSTKGKILYSWEKYRNVTLPMSIRREVSNEENLGYQMQKNQFQSVYFDDNLVKKLYKIHLTDGDTSKKLIIELKTVQE